MCTSIGQILKSILALIVTGLLAQPAFAWCVINDSKIFENGKEKVILARGSGFSRKGNFALFVAPLSVNTDGAPTSYHPKDYRGRIKAINHFANGISIKYKPETEKDVPADEKSKVFEEWRDSNFEVIPTGYKITWRNVLAERDNQPCIFKKGDYVGYFGSLTALKNGLPEVKRGECEIFNQLDQRYIPALVLRGGKANPLTAFGASKGDLVVAINPANGNIVSAIIGDTGNDERIGEGSVALNMKLLGKTIQPTTYSEAKKLDTEDKDIVVAVLPESKKFERIRPYTGKNIEQRIKNWASENKYKSLNGLIKSINQCAKKL